MKLKVKLLTLLLVTSFLPSLSSCNKGKEIIANQAQDIIYDIQKYWDDNYNNHLEDEFTKTLTSKSTLVIERQTSKIDIKVKVAYKDGVIYNNSDYYYGKDHFNNKKSKTYMFEKDGKYYINETEIDKTRYEFTKSSCTVSYTSSSYIDTMNNIVIADIKDYSVAKCKYYSSGSGSITIIKELVSTVNNVSYTHTQEIVYKDYMFISNEEEETNGDSKNIRTESVKYKAFINNPYK